jgi:hypothetical protein
VNLSVNQDDGRPSTGITEILDTEASIAEIWMSCHHTEAASAVQQLYEVLSDNENFVGCKLAKAGKNT